MDLNQMESDLERVLNELKGTNTRAFFMLKRLENEMQKARQLNAFLVKDLEDQREYIEHLYQTIEEIDSKNSA